MKNFYPALRVDQIKTPNRFYAFPILGYLLKWVILIPVWIWMFFLVLAYLVVLVINSFVVLFTGKYWIRAYTFVCGYMRFQTKILLYLSGLTDKYPGFGLDINDPLIALDIEMPKRPNRLFALPVLGGVARLILFIPYYLFTTVIGYGAWGGTAIASFVVLFAGRYPESAYELTRDHVRVSMAGGVYLSGLFDRYPVFWISMNHKPIKIALIIFGVIMTILNLVGNTTPTPKPAENEFLYPETLDQTSYDK